MRGPGEKAAATVYKAVPLSFAHALLLGGYGDEERGSARQARGEVDGFDFDIRDDIGPGSQKKPNGAIGSLADGIFSFPGDHQFFWGRGLTRHNVPVPDGMPISNRDFQPHAVGREVNYIRAQHLAFFGIVTPPGGMQEVQALTFLVNGDFFDFCWKLG
jgi:hypothetical protein